MNPSAPSAYDEKSTTGIPVPGQFQANHPGQFQANHPGQYQANHPGQYQANHPGTWSTGLCDCSSDCSSCCLTCWCPCITFGRIAEIVDKGTFPCVASGALYFLIAALTGCGCFYSCFYRKKMRKQYMLPESPCGDCLLHFCCEGCALCQEYRELKHRGYDMSIGWLENMDKHNRGIQMAPGVQGGMTR